MWIPTMRAMRTQENLYHVLCLLFMDLSISWKANQHFMVALTTTQTKYIIFAEGVKEATLFKL